MKKIFFLLLLVFGICSFSCQSIDTISAKNDNESGENKQKKEILSTNSIDKTSYVKNEFICINNELLGIWQEIWKDKFVREFFENELADGDCSEYLTIAKRVDLNQDGADELFVEGRGKISAASTTPIWVMQKKGDGFKSLLREQGEFYYIRKSKTNGYQDLYFPSRRSTASAVLSTYKFKNGEYQVAQCQVEFYNEPRNIRKKFDCNDKEEIEQFEVSLSKSN
jgi:hypothetical protein